MSCPLAGFLAFRFNHLRGRYSRIKPPRGSRLYVYYGDADHDGSELFKPCEALGQLKLGPDAVFHRRLYLRLCCRTVCRPFLLKTDQQNQTRPICNLPNHPRCDITFNHDVNRKIRLFWSLIFSVHSRGNSLFFNKKSSIINMTLHTGP